MRIVILAPGVYSETSCAVAVQLAESGYVPSGALALSTVNWQTLLRKIGQTGLREVMRYGTAKLVLSRPAQAGKLFNPYLQSFLSSDVLFRNLQQVSRYYDFPLTSCRSQNDVTAIEQLKDWNPDLLIFTGGNLLREEVLAIPRLGVLNVHLGLLPEVRGMNSPEWSLLQNVPVGITIHFMDAGIDTGPIVGRYELPDRGGCLSLVDLRNRLIAFGIAKLVEAVAALDRQAARPIPQSRADRKEQFFVMHEWLQARAAERLASNLRATAQWVAQA